MIISTDNEQRWHATTTKAVTMMVMFDENGMDMVDGNMGHPEDQPVQLHRKAFRQKAAGPSRASSERGPDDGVETLEEERGMSPWPPRSTASASAAVVHP